MSTNRSGTISVGGEAVAIVGANPARSRLLFQNQSDEPLWLKVYGGGSVVATMDHFSIKILPDQIWDSSVSPGVSGDPIFVIGPTAGQAFFCEEW